MNGYVYSAAGDGGVDEAANSRPDVHEGLHHRPGLRLAVAVACGELFSCAFYHQRDGREREEGVAGRPIAADWTARR